MGLPGRYCIAADIGDSGVSCVQLEPGRSGPQIARAAFAEFPPPPAGAEAPGDEQRLATLRDTLRRGRFRGRRVAMLLPPDHVYTVPLSFPRSKTDSVETGILRELQKHLPFIVEEGVVDYPSLDTSGALVRVLVAAMRRDVIGKYVAGLEAAGYSLEAVDVSIAALARLHLHLAPPGANPVLLCHAGAARTWMAVVGAGSILAENSLAWGVQGLIQKLRVNLNLADGHGSAHFLLREYGLSYEDRGAGGAALTDERKDASRVVYQIAAPVVDELIRAIHAVTAYVRSEAPHAAIEGAFLYGRASGIRGIDRYIQTRIGLRTALTDPLSKIPPVDDAVLAGLPEGESPALALGLGLRKFPWL